VRTSTGILCIIIFAALLGAADAQQTREQSIAGMRKVEAKEMDPTYTTAASHAQKLVDEALARHPEVFLLAIHVAPPVIRTSSSRPTSAASVRYVDQPIEAGGARDLFLELGMEVTENNGYSTAASSECLQLTIVQDCPG
jgi:hypothetical protein